MIAPTWELACCLIVFQVLQAIAVVAFLALLLWFEKRTRARRIQTAGDMA
jgi:hypothetical protein